MNEFVIYGKALEAPKAMESEKGNSYTSLLIEVDRNYSSGDNGPTSDVFKLVSFKAVAKELCERVKKGTKLIVKGRIQANNYKKENGEPGYRAELVGERYEYID